MRGKQLTASPQKTGISASDCSDFPQCSSCGGQPKKSSYWSSTKRIRRDSWSLLLALSSIDQFNSMGCNWSPASSWGTKNQTQPLETGSWTSSAPDTHHNSHRLFKALIRVLEEFTASSTERIATHMMIEVMPHRHRFSQEKSGLGMRKRQSPIWAELT